MAELPKSIGWIGLGLMGNPMIRNLLKKMSEDTQFFIHDVVRESVDKLVEEGKGRVHACESSVEVADKSVRTILTIITAVIDPHIALFTIVTRV